MALLKPPQVKLISLTAANEHPKAIGIRESQTVIGYTSFRMGPENATEKIGSAALTI